MPTSPNNIQQYPTFLTKVKLCPTSSNNTQHHPTMPDMGGQTIPTFIPNIVGICWAKMLASFGQGFTNRTLLYCKDDTPRSNILTTLGPWHLRHKAKLKFRYDYKLHTKQKERRKTCPAVDVELMNLKG